MSSNSDYSLQALRGLGFCRVRKFVKPEQNVGYPPVFAFCSWLTLVVKLGALSVRRMGPLWLVCTAAHESWRRMNSQVWPVAPCGILNMLCSVTRFYLPPGSCHNSRCAPCVVFLRVCSVMIYLAFCKERYLAPFHTSLNAKSFPGKRNGRQPS